MPSRLSKKEGNLHKLMMKESWSFIRTTTYAPGTTYAHLPPFPTSVWLSASTLWGPILFISCSKIPLYDLDFYQRLMPLVSVLGIYWSLILHIHPSDAQDCKFLKELCLLSQSPGKKSFSSWAVRTTERERTYWAHSLWIERKDTGQKSRKLKQAEPQAEVVNRPEPRSGAGATALLL